MSTSDIRTNYKSIPEIKNKEKKKKSTLSDLKTIINFNILRSMWTITNC